MLTGTYLEYQELSAEAPPLTQLMNINEQLLIYQQSLV